MLETRMPQYYPIHPQNNTVGQPGAQQGGLLLTVGFTIVVVAVTSAIIAKYIKKRQLLYLGEFFSQGPDIWRKWASLDFDSLIGIYNVADNILRQMRFAIKETTGIHGPEKRIAKINNLMAEQDWNELLQKSLPEYRDDLPKHFFVTLNLSRKGSPKGKVCKPIFDKRHKGHINEMGIIIDYRGKFGKHAGLKELRGTYLPMVAHLLTWVVQYIRFGPEFEKEQRKISASITANWVKKLQDTGDQDVADEYLSRYHRALPWQLEAKAVSAGAAMAVIEYYKGKGNVLGTRLARDIINEAEDSAFDIYDVLEEFNINPEGALDVYLELMENARISFLTGLRAKKQHSGFVSVSKKLLESR